MDIIAKRYGRLPSEIRERSLEDFQFDMLVTQYAIEFESKKAKEGQVNVR